MDNRVGNCRWVVPPKVQLSSPEVIAALDFSQSQLKGSFVHMAAADAPLHYYRLLVEEWMLPSRSST